MNRRNLLRALAGLGALVSSRLSLADQPRSGRPRRIGLLPDLNFEQLEWFKDAMRRLGWSEGRDFTLVASGVSLGPRAEPLNTRMVVAPSRASPEGIPTNTKRLLDSNPDLILATSTAYAVAAHNASATTPVVMWTGGYPVEAGIANSLAQPGKNVTGTSIYAGTGIWGKLIELLWTAKPTIKTVGVLWDYLPPAFPAAEMELCYSELRRAEGILGVRVHLAPVSDSRQLDEALSSLEAKGADALLVTSGWALLDVRQRVMDYAASKRLPLIVDFRWKGYLDPYPLLVYGAVQNELMQSAASYVVKILEGARAGDLPVLQPARFELVVNLRTAKRIGLEIPKSILLRADSVVE